MKLSIIIPTLYQWEYLAKIIENIKNLKLEFEHEIIIICNKLVNEAWSDWVVQSKGDYIFIINDDIEIYPWTIEKLIEQSNKTKIACPYFSRRLDKDIIEGSNWDNLAWWAFMFRKDYKNIFPIPKELKIWYWDNYIYQMLDKDVWYAGRIHHWESKTVLSDEHRARINLLIQEDTENWILLSKNKWWQ